VSNQSRRHRAYTLQDLQVGDQTGHRVGTPCAKALPSWPVAADLNTLLESAAMMAHKHRHHSTMIGNMMMMMMMIIPPCPCQPAAETCQFIRCSCACSLYISAATACCRCCLHASSCCRNAPDSSPAAGPCAAMAAASASPATSHACSCCSSSMRVATSAALWPGHKACGSERQNGGKKDLLSLHWLAVA
jgi:hypothetical protein